MRFDVIKNIRKNNFITSIPLCIFTFFCCLLTIMFVIESEMWYLAIFFGIMSALFIKPTINCIILVINPMKSDIFKKYGDLNEIKAILDEISYTVEYKDYKIIVSKNYVMPKDDIEGLMACKDILRVHKIVHKTNFVIDGYYLAITDKYNQEFKYRYDRDEENIVNELIMQISQKCDNAKVGYNSLSSEHIKNNTVKLEEKKDEYYICPECNKEVSSEDCFCVNCGCKLDWNFEEDKKEDTHEIIYCTKCGKKINEKWTFCRYCGEKNEEM